MTRYRHEHKHEISYHDMITIRQRVRAVMKPDPHAVNGKYLIRSLYFDNLRDKALKEKIDGVNCREKFRIRYYDFDTSMIRLEKKSKRSGLGSKVSAPLLEGEAGSIINNGDKSWMLHSEHPLIRELYSKMVWQRLAPKTIVDYEREPYIFEPGNVRVTFDYNIRTGLSSTDFLNPDTFTVPVTDAFVILEVKWDEFLPDIIKDCVQTPGRRMSAFSKYAVCRMYG